MKVRNAGYQSPLPFIVSPVARCPLGLRGFSGFECAVELAGDAVAGDEGAGAVIISAYFRAADLSFSARLARYSLNISTKVSPVTGCRTLRFALSLQN
jgi:hypothetical protein